MRVEYIEWISREAEEAEVVVSHGHFSCRAFSQPCLLSVGQVLEQPLHVFGAKNIMRSAAEEQSIELQVEGGLAHKVTGIFKDSQSKRIIVGGIEMVLDDYIPGGLQVGDMIDFECARIDVW
ncbi:hypothetical protein OU995_16625 [Roseateles sp. SL47]|uniref:hypothetical protein n=1 Tax=Roseateles sp. SL47 TaxID=2995138 RepID=UPI0022709B9C|nr:hypothetical protein [Roseateles sp. SL47]WAC71214.1 hypothetical protein OU995_16625 [Roseateles sp. SL47]